MKQHNNTSTTPFAPSFVPGVTNSTSTSSASSLDNRNKKRKSHHHHRASNNNNNTSTSTKPNGNKNTKSMPCPYQFTPQGCQHTAHTCKFLHVNSRLEANKMKLKYMLGDEYDEDAIERALRVFEEAAGGVSAADSAAGDDTDALQNLEIDSNISEDDVNHEKNIPIYDEEEPDYDYSTANPNASKPDASQHKAATTKQLFTSLQRALCGQKVDSELFEATKLPLGQVLCEVNWDLNIKSLESAEEAYDVGTAVCDSEGTIIGIISEVIGNIRMPNYRVSVPKALQKKQSEEAHVEITATTTTEELETTTKTSEDDANNDDANVEDATTTTTTTTTSSTTTTTKPWIDLQQLAEEESTVYIVPKYANKISDPSINKKRMQTMLQNIQKENNRTTPTVAAENNEPIDLSTLPQDVHYITSLLTKGATPFSNSDWGYTSFPSMWVSDDPTQNGAPSSPQDEEQEAIFEDPEVEASYRGTTKKSSRGGSTKPQRGKRRGGGGRNQRNNNRNKKRSRDAAFGGADNSSKGKNKIRRTEQRSYGSSRFTVPKESTLRGQADAQQNNDSIESKANEQKEEKGFFQNVCVIS